MRSREQIQEWINGGQVGMGGSLHLKNTTNFESKILEVLLDIRDALHNRKESAPHFYKGDQDSHITMIDL